MTGIIGNTTLYVQFYLLCNEMMAITAFPTPILLIVYNRPDETKRVFEAIRSIKPTRLYLAADGARKEIESDASNCRAVRQIVDKVDWDCEIHKLYRDENLGSDLGVSEAINWFFAKELEGIVLEDDCLPGDSFFQFCRELLERYRDDLRVMHIGGSNFLNGWHHEDYAYYFSRNGFISGWATWRRAWNHMGFNPDLYQAIKKRGFFGDFFVSRTERNYWLRRFDQLAANENDRTRWFHRWTFSRFIQSGLAIVPRDTLIMELSTKAGNVDGSGKTMVIQEGDEPLLHPPFVIRDIESDRRYDAVRNWSDKRS